MNQSRVMTDDKSPQSTNFQLVLSLSSTEGVDMYGRTQAVRSIVARRVQQDLVGLNFRARRFGLYSLQTLVKKERRKQRPSVMNQTRETEQARQGG